MQLKSFILSGALLCSLSSNASEQIDGLWETNNAVSAKQKPGAQEGSEDQRHLKLAFDVFASKLHLAPAQKLSSHGVEVDLPLPNGKFVRFELFESSIMEESLTKKYPQIKTYWGRQVGNPENTGRFDLTPHGFHGMFQYAGEQVFIDPETREDTSGYVTYLKSASGIRDQKRSFHDRVIRRGNNQSRFNKSSNKAIQTDAVERQYRIAVAVTGEYTQFHGGTKEKGLAAVATAINRVNQVYQNDLAVKFVLVGANDKLIYTDAASDPYTNTDSDLDTNTANIDKEIGADNYDIGHIFVTTGGGVAGFEVVCSSSKGDGLTGSESPNGDAFHIDYVAHEIGHQFGAEHTFNGCDDNRAEQWAFEPGSGTTIMGYAGLCDDRNVQNNSDPYFHTKSVSQMFQFISQGGGASCAVKKDLSNQSPTVNAGNDFTIPAQTPFELTGSATDNDTGDQTKLSYTWEQTDLGPEEKTASDMVDDGRRPLFRSFEPSSSASRTFPRLSDVLAGTTTKGETYPTTSRDLNFTLTVRDTKGGVGTDATKITVKKEAGPFKITAPDGGQWSGGSQQTVSWDVANTNVAPINCTVVDISLSTDGGQNFTHTLATNTANDGTEIITVPSADSSSGRVKVKCSDNVFFAINGKNITVGNGGGGGGGGGGNQAPRITGQQSLSLDEDANITIKLTDLTVVDGDNNFPADFTLKLVAGSNYSLDGNRVTPTANFNGELSIPVTVNDGKADSNSFALKVTVNAVNDAPSAQDDQFQVEQDSASTAIDVLANDSDVDSGDTLTISAISYSGSSTVSHDNQRINYQPAANFHGTETIQYTISDKAGATTTATLTVTVTQKSGGGNGGGNTGGGSSGGGSLGWLLMLGLLVCARRKF
ncbi:reprolysin-like metallopeptidase [Aliikangiella coralliicola]|uniref:GlyGly-CTERM sorting domain-containing protein n=1 Tax=Aliikangiella coralliicola TaxID=2592383 RepID=A0A545UCW6_9GAMM|nr:zinc-dependent metalloprotease family protein [Aliikangiella coralliicola]TQV87273.1 GlyGly-CTERM sorting domain-containing protein [Aliikangiella coralliicola]